MNHPGPAIKRGIPADDDEITRDWQDAHRRKESRWKPKEVPLGDDRLLVLDAEQI
jgi:hypothetical protein